MAKLRYCSWIVLLWGAQLAAQSLQVSTTQIGLTMPETGPLPPIAKFTISGDGPWTVSSSDTDVVQVQPAQGTGTGTVSVTTVDWRKPGVFTAQLRVGRPGAAAPDVSIAVTLTVVARTLPVISYPNGAAVGCLNKAGLLPVNNAANCTVPNEKPPGGFAPPAVGGTYVDPNFGGTVRVIAGPRAQHGYSSPSPMSASNRYTVVGIQDQPVIVESLTGKKVRDLPVSYEGILWDAVDDRYFYFLSESRVRRFDVQTGQQTTVADYTRGDQRFQSITSGGTGDMSKDNWLSFFAPQERQACALDIKTATTYCGAIPVGVTVDFSAISKGVDKGSGQRYVILTTVGSPFVVYAVNVQQRRMDLVSRGPENVLMGNGNHDGVCESGEVCVNGSHSDTMEDADGNQFLLVGMEGQYPCDFSLYSIQLNKGVRMGLAVENNGGLKLLRTLFQCGGDTWVDFHAGCAKSAPLCVISTTLQPFGQTKNPQDTNPIRRSTHVGEIFVIRNNGAEIRRLVQHRSVTFSNEEANGYWSTPRAAISSDGAFVIATSNFGNPNQQRVITIDTGMVRTALAGQNPVLNAANFKTRIAPGVLAIAFGSSLSSCNQSASYPLPDTLCGVQVRVGGSLAHMFYVTPQQVAFLVPENVPASGNVELEIDTTSVYGVPVRLSTSLPDDAVEATAPALFVKAIPAAPFETTMVFDAVWEQRPIRLGEYAIVFAVGLGATNPLVALGQPSPMSEPLARVSGALQCYINGTTQQLLYGGLVPGMSGVYQLVLAVSPDTVLQASNKIWVSVNGVESPPVDIALLPK